MSPAALVVADVEALRLTIRGICLTFNIVAIMYERSKADYNASKPGFGSVIVLPTMRV